VYLHIGLHKTGTSYLQGLWAANRAGLADQGVHYCGADGEPAQRLAAMDALGHRARGTDDTRVSGQWQALVDATARSALPVALVSAEGLSVARPRQVRQIVASFPDREVHVVVTCRDLGRVLVSSWQEAVKNDGTWTWPQYAAAVADPDGRGRSPGRGFWLAQDLPAILATWRRWVPADRIHVVTVPPPAAAPGELHRRVGAVVGYDPAALTAPAEWDNASLGAAGTELVRRLNVALGHRLNQRQHDHVVKSVIVRQLVGSGRGDRYGLPDRDRGWVEAAARDQIAGVRAAGVQVTGELADLLPRVDPTARDPQQAGTAELLEAAVVALTGVSERYATRWWREVRGRGGAAEVALRVRTSSALRAVSFRARRAAATVADRNRFAGRFAARYLDR
jgi:hypothetical protein